MPRPGPRMPLVAVRLPAELLAAVDAAAAAAGVGRSELIRRIISEQPGLGATHPRPVGPRPQPKGHAMTENADWQAIIHAGLDTDRINLAPDGVFHLALDIATVAFGADTEGDFDPDEEVPWAATRYGADDDSEISSFGTRADVLAQVARWVWEWDQCR